MSHTLLNIKSLYYGVLKYIHLNHFHVLINTLGSEYTSLPLFLDPDFKGIVHLAPRTIKHQMLLSNTNNVKQNKQKHYKQLKWTGSSILDRN